MSNAVFQPIYFQTAFWRRGANLANPPRVASAEAAKANIVAAVLVARNACKIDFDDRRRQAALALLDSGTWAFAAYSYQARM